MGIISSVFVRKVVAAASVSLNKDELLRSVGVDPDATSELAQMIPDNDYYALMEKLADAEQGRPKFQIGAGASMKCEDYGAFGMAMKAATSLRGTFGRAERYAKLLTSVSNYTVEPMGDEAFICLHREGHRRGLLLSNEATLASLISICREVSHPQSRPIAVHFKHQGFSSAEAYHAFFGCKMVFSSSRNALQVSTQMLDRPNLIGDEAMSQFFGSMLDQELDGIVSQKPIEEQVQLQISQSFSEGVPRMSEVAPQLGMSERTLHRRLSELGLTFQSLVEQSRQQMAETLLQQSQYSLAEIAFLTGFSEQSAFTRAFKRWVGLTPALYRQENLGS